MNKLKVISFTTPNYTWYRMHLDATLKEYGIEHYPYTSAWLKSQHIYKEHYDVLSAKRGAGYWAWKPFIIQDALSRSDSTDIICYMDSNTLFHKNPEPFIRDNNFFSPYTACPTSTWTKRDCFVLMDCDEEKYWKSTHCWAAIIVVKPGSNWIVDEWMSYCWNKQIISDDPNIMGKENLPGFTDHRHDQSILTNLLVKHNIPYIPASEIFHEL